MRVCLGKQRNVTSTEVVPRHETALELFQEVEELDTKYSWTIISPHRNLSVIYTAGE
jgi:hypothetical protein